MHRQRSSSRSVRLSKDEEKTGFPHALMQDVMPKYNDDNVDELAENESLDVINVLTCLGKDNPMAKKFCASSCRFNHNTTPKFFTDDPNELASDDDGQQEICPETLKANVGCHLERDREMRQKKNCRLHEVPTSVIAPAPLWFERAPEVVDYLPKCSEGEYSRRVKHELGFEFPPVMGKCLENLVTEIWTNVSDQECDGVSDLTSDKDYHSLVVDAQVTVARFLQAYVQRRSEPEASKREAVADEKVVAREILGKHHSDIDSSSSSDNEEDNVSTPLDLPQSSIALKYNFKSSPSDSSESSDTELSLSDGSTSSPSSLQSDGNKACFNVTPKRLTRSRAQKFKLNVDTSMAHTPTIIARRKRRSSSAGCPSGEVDGDSFDKNKRGNAASPRQKRSRRRSVPLKEVNSSSSNSPEAGSNSAEASSESDSSCWSQESDEWIPSLERH